MNNSNLKPFTGTHDPRRSNGRPKGVKNLKTIIKELGDEKFNWDKIPSQGKKLDSYLRSMKSPWRAIVISAMLDAVKGNKDAREWLTEASGDESNSIELETREPIIMSHIKPRFNTENSSEDYEN